nr:IS5 family transposase [Rhodoplanes sp.]
MGRERRLAETLPRFGQRRRTARASSDRQFRREGPSLGGRRERGAQTQAIGRSRGGRTTKIHALTDRHCRLIAFLLTGGNVADCTAGHDLLKQLPDARILHADKGYDSNAIRAQVEANGTMPNIPPKVNRRWKSTFSRVLYRNRNAIERMFCRLKDFRRVATRYDRLAVNFLATVHIAATISYWL